MMAIGEILHALVPTLVVAKVRELFEQDAAVLPGDRRYLAILGAASVRSVAGRAGSVQLGAVLEIGLEPRALGEFTVAGDARRGGLCPGDALGDQHQYEQTRECAHWHKLCAATDTGIRSVPHWRRKAPDARAAALPNNKTWM